MKLHKSLTSLVIILFKLLNFSLMELECWFFKNNFSLSFILHCSILSHLYHCINDVFKSQNGPTNPALLTSKPPHKHFPNHLFDTLIPQAHFPLSHVPQVYLQMFYNILFSPLPGRLTSILSIALISRP